MTKDLFIGLYFFRNLILKLFIVLVLTILSLIRYQDVPITKNSWNFLKMMFYFQSFNQKTLLPSVIPSLQDKIIFECKDDTFYHKICEYLENNNLPITQPKIDKFSLSKGFLLFQNKLYVPPNYRTLVLKICHDSPSAIHFGINKTTNLLSRDFWWSSLSTDVKDYVRSCETCCRSKDSKHKPYGLLNH